VRLEVPATPEFLRITRIMAAGVASRLGFTLDDVEDLRIAIDELCFALVGKAGREGTVSLRYEMLDEGLAVEGTSHFTDDGTREAILSPMSGQILGAMVDEVHLGSGPGGPTFRMLKRLRPA